MIKNKKTIINSVLKLNLFSDFFFGEAHHSDRILGPAVLLIQLLWCSIYRMLIIFLLIKICLIDRIIKYTVNIHLTKIKFHINIYH